VATRKKSAKATPARLAAEQAGLRSALAEKLGELRALRTEGAGAWDQEWELVGEILEHEPPLWRGTYASESELIRKELPGETMRSVRRNVTVARAFSARDVKEHGVNVLEELALYLMERDGASRPPRAIDLDRVIVMVPRGRGQVARFSARGVEIELVRAARRALRKGSAGGRRAGPEERAIRSALRAKRSLRAVTVGLSRSAVTLGNVPLDALGDLAAALKTVRLG
jgi:hypothetical protein